MLKVNSSNATRYYGSTKEGQVPRLGRFGEVSWWKYQLSRINGKMYRNMALVVGEGEKGAEKEHPGKDRRHEGSMFF